MRLAGLAVVILSFALLATPVFAVTWHILPDGSGDAPTIHAGIDSAGVGDTVLLGPGVYYEFNIVMKSSICLRGDGAPESVIIDGKGMGTILHCTELGEGTSIESITFTGGAAPGGYGGGIRCQHSLGVIRQCVFRDNTAFYGGAGICCSEQSSPLIIHCRFHDNFVEWNGAGIASYDSDPAIQSCEFVENSANHYGGGISCKGLPFPTITDVLFRSNTAGLGGGVFCKDGSVTLSNVAFVGNSATSSGGGLYLSLGGSPSLTDVVFTENSSSDGGGMYSFLSAASLVDVIFERNVALSDGGGIWFLGSSPTLMNVSFVGNSATRGGGMKCDRVSPALSWVVFWHNVAAQGGALYCISDANPVLTNCSLVGDSAGSGGEIYCMWRGSPRVRQSVLAGGRGGGAVACHSGTGPYELEFNCSDVFGNVGGDWIGCIADEQGGDGNISADPLFCGSDMGDFTLRSDSPCLPGQHPDGYDCGLIGAFGEGCTGPTAVERTTWGGIKSVWR